MTKKLTKAIKVFWSGVFIIFWTIIYLLTLAPPLIAATCAFLIAIGVYFIRTAVHNQTVGNEKEINEILDKE